LMNLKNMGKTIGLTEYVMEGVKDMKG